MSGGGMPELGSKISLISKADIRYEGRLYTVDPQECTIALSSVRSFGTEDRETQFQIAPQSQIYDYILFRGSDIKDIRVINNLPHPNDPAIMQVHVQNGQQLVPHFPMPNMNASAPQIVPGGYPFGNIGAGLGNIGAGGGAGAVGSATNNAAVSGSMASAAGVPGAAFMLGNQQQQPPQQQQQAKQAQTQHKQSNVQLEPKSSTTEESKTSNQEVTTRQTATSSTISGSNKTATSNGDGSSNIIGGCPVGAGRLFSEIVGGGGGGGTGVGVGSAAGSGVVVGAVGVQGGLQGGHGLQSGSQAVLQAPQAGGGLSNDIRNVIGPSSSSNLAKQQLLSPHSVALAPSEHKDQDMLAGGGGSRSTTPINLMSRKSPTGEIGAQVNQQQQQHQSHNQMTHGSNQNNAAGSGHAGGNNNKRQGHHQQQQRGGNNNQQQRHNDFYNHHQQQQQRDRRDSGRQDNQQHQQHDMRSNYNQHQRSNNQAGGGNAGNNGGGGPNNRNWNMHRGGPNNPNMMRQRGGGMGRGRMPNQGYRQMGGVPGGINQNKPRNSKNTIKFEQDFDFEQANNKFEELRSQLSKLKVGEEPKSTEQLNGETDKKDDSGNETGAGEHEHEDDEITVGYDKTKSFFDNISCEAAQDRTKNKKNDWRQERKLNSETFGVSSTRRGSYRGRNNYFNRNIGNYNGGGNRGYRPGMNYRNRNMNNNNNRHNVGGNVVGNSRENNSAGGDANANGNASNNNNSAVANNTPKNQQAAGSAISAGTTGNSSSLTGATSKSTPQQANIANNLPQLTAAAGQ